MCIFVYDWGYGMNKEKKEKNKNNGDPRTKGKNAKNFTRAQPFYKICTNLIHRKRAFTRKKRASWCIIMKKPPLAEIPQAVVFAFCFLSCF